MGSVLQTHPVMRRGSCPARRQSRAAGPPKSCFAHVCRPLVVTVGLDQRVSLREGPILSEASPHRSFDELVDEAVSEPIEGWDFSFLRGRTEEQPIPWSYQDIARSLVAQARRVLDVDTGGGEMFSSLRPTQGSVAVEPYHSNVAVAARRLDPLGVRVVERTDETLPVGDGLFDLVLNRRGYLHATETHRVFGAWWPTANSTGGCAQRRRVQRGVRHSAGSRSHASVHPGEGGR